MKGMPAMNATKAKSRTKPKERRLTASAFEALPDAEKERIYQELDNETPEQRLARSKPLTREQRKRWNRIKKNLGGRPKHGKYGTQIISVTVEKELLAQANAYARAKGMKRSELVTQGLKLAMQQDAA
jgi:hypothetical protein